MRKWIVEALTPVLCGLAFLLSIIALGRSARAALHERETYTLRFGAIDCQPPPGLSRQAFLAEVQAHARQPESLHLLDEDLNARLHRAFAVHPWVEAVQGVSLQKANANGSTAPRVVHVDLVYRRPVLAIPPSIEAKQRKRTPENGWRLVDRQAILLPAVAIPAHVPVLSVPVAFPTGPAGSRWADARVAAAARTAAFLQPHLAQLGLDDSDMEMAAGEIVFCRPGVRIVWGHAPGQEEEGEAPAKVKLRRLLEYQQAHDGLESLEHDVRLVAYQGHFPLPATESVTAVSLYGSNQLPSRRNWDQVSNSSRSWRSCFTDAKAPSTSASSH